MRVFTIVIALFAVNATLAGQTINYPIAFQQLLTEVEIDFFEPVEARYKDVEIKPNDYQAYDLRLYSRKEKLEIRYAIKPYSEADIMSQNPHLLTMRAVSSIATNDEAYIITALEMSPTDLAMDFNADWGMTYFFTPKGDFSEAPHCRLIALYKEGKGTAFAIYLFEDPSNEALDTRYQAFRFKKERVIID